MKKILVILALCLFFVGAKAQNYTLKGTLIDENGFEIAYATVTDSASKIIANSDDMGNFSISLPMGERVLQIRALGYTSKTEIVSLYSDKDLKISMQEQVILLEEVILERKEVQKSLNTVEMSTEELAVEEIKKIPAFLGEPDLIEAIKLLPGVTSVGEGASGFNVRGGNIDQNLILSDNASIYSSSHLFGFFSVFNPDAVKGLKLYKGVIPAKFGERVSSVLDVEQRSGSLEKYHIDGGIGLVSSRLTVGGPIIKNKLSFILSGRRTYVDQFFRFANNESLKNTKTYFYDLNAKLDYVVNNKHYLSFTGYYGRDVFNLNKGTFGFDYGNAFGVINWEYAIRSNLKMKSSISLTDYSYALSFDDFFTWSSRITTSTQKVNFEYNKIKKHLIGFGIQNNNHHFRPARLVASPDGPFKDLFTDFSVPQEWAMEQGLYAQDEYEFSKKITLLGGVRYSLYNSFGSVTELRYASGQAKETSTVIDTLNFKKNQSSATYMALEPRISALYKIDSLSSLKFAYNRNVQFLQLVSNTSSGLPLDVWKAADYHIKPLKVNQVAVGYVRGLLQNKIEATAEVYYKQLRDVMDYKNNADLFLNANLETELLAGKGRAYGLELMLRKKKGKYTGWLSYTLSRTELLVKSNIKSETINNGNWYKASFDKPHDVSFVSTYQWTKRFSTSLNFVYATGRAITLPDGKYEVYGTVIPSYSARNQGRLSPYHRMDLSAELQNKKNETRKWQSYWTFSVFNLYARRNAYSYTFTGEPGENSSVSRLAILGTVFPSATYNFKF